MPGGVQGYDRYAYGLNNPLKFNDPDGHCPICIGLVLVGTFFIFNGTSESYQPNLTTSELESRQTSVDIGTSLILSGMSIKSPIVEVLSNAYDCSQGVCDPSLIMPGSTSAYKEAGEELEDVAERPNLFRGGNSDNPKVDNI